ERVARAVAGAPSDGGGRRPLAPRQRRVELHGGRHPGVPGRVPGNRRTTQEVTNPMIPVKRLNHAVLYVRDAQASADFYEKALDFQVVGTMGRAAAFLRASASDNHHDLALFSIGTDAPGPEQGRVGSTTSRGRCPRSTTSSTRAHTFPRWARSSVRATTA